MLETDPKLLRILQTIDERPQLPLNKIVSEAILLLKNIPRHEPNSKSLLRSRAMLSDGRTKLIEKRVEIIKELEYLKGAKDDLETYLHGKYINTLKQYTAKQTDFVVAKALLPLTKRVRRLDTALKVVLTILEDYDARGYSIKDMVLALKIGEYE